MVVVEEKWCIKCKKKVPGKFCTDCGTELQLVPKWCRKCKIESSGKFCSECGDKLVSLEEVATAEPGIWCPTCKVDRKGKFCIDCGGLLEHFDPLKEDAQQTSGNSVESMAVDEKVSSTCTVPEKMEVDGEDTVNSTAVTKDDVPDEKEVNKLNKEMNGGQERQKSAEEPADCASTHVKLAENREEGGESETLFSLVDDENSRLSTVVLLKLGQNDNKKSSDNVESILRDEVIKSPNDNTKTSEKSSSVKPNESPISSPAVVSAEQIPLKEKKDSVSTSKDETVKSLPACDANKENISTSSEVSHKKIEGMSKLANIQQKNEISETAENQKSGEKNTTTKNVVPSTCSVPDKMEVDGEDTVNSTAVTKNDVPDEKEVSKLNKEMDGGKTRQKSTEKPVDHASTHVKLAENKEQGGENETSLSSIDEDSKSSFVVVSKLSQNDDKKSSDKVESISRDEVIKSPNDNAKTSEKSSSVKPNESSISTPVVVSAKQIPLKEEKDTVSTSKDETFKSSPACDSSKENTSSEVTHNEHDGMPKLVNIQQRNEISETAENQKSGEKNTTTKNVVSSTCTVPEKMEVDGEDTVNSTAVTKDDVPDEKEVNKLNKEMNGGQKRQKSAEEPADCASTHVKLAENREEGGESETLFSLVDDENSKLSTVVLSKLGQNDNKKSSDNVESILRDEVIKSPNDNTKTSEKSSSVKPNESPISSPAVVSVEQIPLKEKKDTVSTLKDETVNSLPACDANKENTSSEVSHKKIEGMSKLANIQQKNEISETAENQKSGEKNTTTKNVVPSTCSVPDKMEVDGEDTVNSTAVTKNDVPDEKEVSNLNKEMDGGKTRQKSTEKPVDHASTHVKLAENKEQGGENETSLSSIDEDSKSSFVVVSKLSQNDDKKSSDKVESILRDEVIKSPNDNTKTSEKSSSVKPNESSISTPVVVSAKQIPLKEEKDTVSTSKDETFKSSPACDSSKENTSSEVTHNEHDGMPKLVNIQQRNEISETAENQKSGEKNTTTKNVENDKKTLLQLSKQEQKSAINNGKKGGIDELNGDKGSKSSKKLTQEVQVSLPNNGNTGGKRDPYESQKQKKEIPPLPLKGGFEENPMVAEDFQGSGNKVFGEGSHNNAVSAIAKPTYAGATRTDGSGYYTRSKVSQRYPTSHDPMWFKIPPEHLAKENNITIQFFIGVAKDTANYFHNSKCAIFFGSRKLSYWNQPAVEMKVIERGKEFYVLQGELTVPGFYLEAPIDYKYAVLHSSGFFYEILYTATRSGIEGYRNRLLRISSEILKKRTFIYQVDDLILPPVSDESGIFQRWFGSSNVDKMKNFSDRKCSELFSYYVDISAMLFRDNLDRKMYFLIAVYSGFFDSYSRLHDLMLQWEKIKSNTTKESHIKKMKNYLQSNIKAINSSNLHTADKHFYFMNSLSTVAYMEQLVPANQDDFICVLFQSLSLEYIDSGDALFETVTNMFSGTAIELILNGLQRFMKKALYESTEIMPYSHCWCYPLVLIHFLSGECVPYGDPRQKKLTIENVNRQSCGLDSTKQEYLHDRFLDATFKNLTYFKNSLKMDKLLQRSLAFLMKARHYPIGMKSRMFNDRLLMRMMNKYVESSSFRREQVSDLTATIYQLKEIVATDKKESVSERSVLMDTLLDLLIQSAGKIPVIADNMLYYTELVEAAIICYNSILCMVNNHDEDHKKRIDMLKAQINKKLVKIGNVVKDSLIHKSRWHAVGDKAIGKELRIIESFLKIKFDGVENCLELKKTMHEILHDKIKEIYQFQELEFIKVYSNLDITSYLKEIQDVFQEICSTLLDTIAENPNSGKFMEMLSFRKDSYNILCGFFQREWRKNKTFHKKLEHCLVWPPMKSFLNIFSRNKTGDGVDEVISEASSILSSTADQIVDSTISMKLLESLYKKKEIFCSLNTALGNESENTERYQRLLSEFDKRVAEIQSFKEAILVMKYFLYICKELPEGYANMSTLQAQVLAENIQYKPFKEIYDPENSIFTYFQITPELYYTAAELYSKKVLSNGMFNKSWTRVVHDTIQSGEIQLGMTHIQIFDVVVKPVLKTLRNTVTTLVTGEATFRSIMRLFDKSQLDNLQSELNMSKALVGLDYSNGDVSACVSKINCLFQLRECLDTIEQILRVKDKLQLTGDFTTVIHIKTQISSNDKLTLKEINEKIVRDAQLLLQVSPDMIAVFKEVSSCLPILQWLRQNLKDPKEVKVFVEMMSIAAGENDYEVDRVACFEASCIAFSPMIFNLDEQSGFSELYTACKDTADELKNDKTIIDKLIDSNRYVEWFKQAKDAQGSVATKSIMQAKSINRQGRYIIGNIKNNYKRFIEEEATLSEAIQLIVKTDDDKENEYKLEEIHDLQSRLMLLGGDGVSGAADNKNQEKYYFVEMSDVVTRLANVYVSLCEAGAVQWLHYKKEIKCDIEAALESRMESWFKDLKDEITELERHLKEWKLELEEYRKMNPHINYFTVKQCLVLQHNLHPLNKNLALVNKLPPQVFTLLKVLAEDVNVEKIKNAFFLSNIGEKHEENKDWQKVTSPKATNFNQIPYNKISKYLDALQNEHNFDENVSLACLVRCYPFTMSKAIIWCNRQDPDSELIDEIANEAEEELDMLKQNFESSEMVIDEEGTSDEIIAPFLSLKHFGQFLRTLTEESQVKKLKRATPAYLNEDKPSLLILPKDDMLYGVLELYLQHSDSLPYMEEVLLCSDEVSLEQIYLLLLRAVYNSYGLYCLVFADNLGYSSSEKVFVFLKELMAEVAQFSGKMNPLVFVCSSDNENRSYLTSALDAYQVKPPMHHQKDEIHSLLQNQLCLKKEIEKTKECAFAAQVDHQGYNTRVIKSEIGGMGKSLVVADKAAELENLTRNSRKWKSRMRQSVRPETLVVTTPIHGISVEVHDVVDALCVFEEKLDAVFPRIYHFDIAPTVSRGLDCFLFNLIILGYCQACNGKIWRKNKHDLCLIEVTDNVQKKTAAVNHREVKKATHGVMLAMMPTVTCISPEETYKCLVNKGYKRKEWLFNSREFRNSPMQRVYQYLKVFDHSPDAVNNFTFQQNDIRGDHADCLRVLIKYCGIEEPSWMELRNFVHFFNQQLLDSEQSIFTSPIFSHDLRGFKGFVVKFLLEMAKDFSTRSLTDGDVEGSEQNELMVELKRHWEQSSHPYLFFNQDRETLSFLGFNVDAAGNLIDPDQGIVIQANIMSKNLFEDLMRQMERDLVTLTTNYKHLNRSQKLQLLCRVMGLEIVHDPDSTYELTIDNMKKMLAIHMRLRCGIPVILMGETGCGKTRLIRFMCALRAGLTGAINMLLVKVHGGVTAKDIKGRINKAIELAKLNYANHRLSTILFLDEANTTDGIGLIKEIMIDKRVHGKPLALAKCGLEVIAACNPYRRHTENMVSKLESAGLGYHVSAAKTYDKIGHIPLRQLVYRVHPLPESMKPLVWDFGQLNAETEQAYARQIIRRYEQENKLPKNPKFVELLVNVLAASQVYMRQREDECSFVSLRDVERAVQVTSWFYKKIDFLLGLIKKEEFEQDDFLLLHDEIEQSIDKQRRSLVLALGVCYMAQLEDRDSYMAEIQQFFIGEFALINGAQQMKEEIRSCQEIFVKGLKLEDNIACNKALCENVFMMVICVELRIPLFVVGKPGSSKSLAKTIVQDNMQGNLSKSDLFGHFKQIFMSSYQCSPLSTAESIISTFKQCSRFQEGKNLEEYTSVVVLDEVGLAEDSPRMPLKALHPLLEDGTDGSEDLTVDGEELKRKRVAFIGISNWSLDPAKMNRGIMLCRAQPDKKELVNTAKDICGGDPSIKGKIASILTPLAESYLKIYEEQKLCDKLKKYKKEEFFGLRDFYSLIKMVFCHARRNQGVPTLHDFEHSVKRNFSGLEEMDTWSIFKENLLSILPNENSDDQGIVSSLDLIGASFQDCCPCYEVRSQDRSSTNKKRCANARYLLVMTEEYSALPIIEEMFLKDQDNVSVIFGSSFPKDQEFAQICRDINRIKMCMETGRTVVLLNMESLYESLYDALNQYYVYLGGQSYVDLGLGTHRVKCRVHEDFKLIVIADKETVYKSFPIPLINRLEKHYVVTSTCMSAGQKKIVDEIREWAHDFAHVKSSRHTFDETDAFVSFNDDTCASIVIHLAQTNYDDWDEIYEKGKEVLLQLATPDALARLSKSKLVDEQTDLWKTYFKKQDHSSLQTFLQSYFEKNICAECSFVQVTTFSRLLSPDDRNNLQLDDINVQMISLMQFQTEQSFREAINSFFNNQSNQRSLLIIQCSNSAEYSNLVACAQHICKEIKADSRNENGAVCILFLLQLNHTQGGFKTFSGSQSLWSCIHIDELREAMESSPSLIKYAGHSISSLFTFNREHVDLQNSEVVSIVRGCVQAAMRELNEVKHMSTEEIREKIKILSDLLDLKEDISYAFIETFMKVVNDCLCEKESMSLPEEINWVQQEAVEQRHQPDYGTFREALIRCVEDKITPILTVMLNEIDQCNNLMIIKNEPAYKGMWINLLKIFIRVNPENIRNISERVNMFSSRFPFSSQIIHTVDQIIKTHVNKESSEYNLTQIEHAVDAHGIDNILRDLHIGEIQDYIHDLVHSKFSFPAESGFEVLRMSLLIGALIVSKQAFQGTNEDRLPNDGLGIVCVHVALYMFEERFENAVAILNFNPSIAATVLEKIDIDDKEVKVDALALRETLLGLVPNNDELSSQQAEFIWISGVKDIKLLTKAIFHHERACRNRYGIDSKRIMHHSKLLWTKLRILQLYIDNVCPPGVSSRPHERDSIMALWNLIENIDDDMRSIGSWNLIERFIRLALSENENRDNVGDNECVICDEELKDPVTLLCHHTCCYNCTARWLTQSRTCPVCHCLVPDEFNLPTDQLIRKDNYKCGEFKKRCLTFFVEIVTEFCFSRDNIQDVEEDVIKKIMSYAFTSSKDKLTKEFSPVQEYALDPTPVIRSFILQQLLKREECVENYIEECLSTNLKLAESDKDKWNICKLFIHCYEDHLSAVASILKSQTVLSSQYINHIISTLENVLNYFKEKPVHNAISVELLKNVALARLGIIGASSMLCKKYLSKEETADTQTSQELKKLFALLMKFIMNARNTDGHMFLLRQIIRCHGSRELQMAIQKSQFDWLGLKMDDDDSDLVSALESDKYLVHGKGYQEQRDQLSEAIMQESDEGGFESLKQHLAEKNQYDTFIQLAVLRECALSFFDVNSKVSASIEKVFNLQDCFVKMNVARGIINDDVLLELLYHLMVLLERCNTQGLMSLYVTIVNNPQLVQNFYLPTMPSDNFAEVASARPADGSGWVLHRCPRGHAYVITECGRPYTRSRCPECNEGIGGANHQADPGNVVVQNRDLTQPGHSLGSPQQRLNYAVPERHLLPLSVSIQRFLVHLSMLLSSLNGHQQVIHTMITPRIQPDQVIEYLCSHIEQDLKILAQVLGKSSEDVNIITHIFLKHVTEINDVAHNLNELAGKAGRDQYELQFHRHFIETFITLMTTKLDAARCILIGDMRIGANPLMRKLYELDELDIPDFHNIELMTCSQFWSYRQPITLEHFKLVVHEKVVATEGKSVKILSSFLQTEALFRLMNDLPGIIELQNILFVHFNYKLDREGANEMSIKEALSTLAADTQKKVQRLLRRYFGVWNELSAVLADYGRVKTDPNYHPIKMDLKSKLSYVLCARDGPGLCAMALIDFLAFNQNEFLELCLKISGMQREIREVSLLKLKGNDIISYKPDRDLLPLVYAHCDYSLEIGRGTKVEYNLAAIEKRLIENVFFGRARIIIQIEEFMYRDDVKSSKRFNNFNQAVQQTSIPHQEQHKMMVELTEIADISNALRAVEIAIGMLTTTKGDPNMLYKRYLTDVLQMDADEYIGSAKMQNTIRLTHLASTWTMLIVERAKRQHANNKEPFEVEDTFSVNIEDDMKPGLNNYLRHVDTRVLLSLLTEYIVSELQYRNENDADFPLSDTLEMFEDTKGVKEEDRCEKIPDEIELKHIYMFWKLVADVK